MVYAANLTFDLQHITRPGKDNIEQLRLNRTGTK
jgi:hypothetical protein